MRISCYSILKKGLVFLLLISIMPSGVYAVTKKKSVKTAKATSNNSATPSSSASAVSSSKANSVTTTTFQSKEGYTEIDFNLLASYEFEEPNIISKKDVANYVSKIPQNIRDLNGKKVSIRGYFYPVEICEGGTIKDFMLLRNQIMCCFGDSVMINEWLSATMSNGKSLKVNMPSSLVTLFGTLEVGEKFQDGCLLNLYRLKTDKIVENP